MKISNSKKQLAKIIHENGGWREGAEFSTQDSKKDRYPSRVCFYRNKPVLDGLRWFDGDRGMVGDSQACIEGINQIANWHQTILSRDEYFFLYQEHGLEAALDEPLVSEEAKPTIEQLAADYRNCKDYADRKQQEADAAKADAESKLAELVAAGKALGLVLSAVGVEPEPELVITDWRDLRNGDIVVITGSDNTGWKSHENQELDVRIKGDSCEDVYFGIWCMSDNTEWRFIRRPSKGEANA